LNMVYPVNSTDQFDALLAAIDQAEDRTMGPDTPARREQGAAISRDAPR
jgi:hypothetical protein